MISEYKLYSLVLVLPCNLQRTAWVVTATVKAMLGGLPITKTCQHITKTCHYIKKNVVAHTHLEPSTFSIRHTSNTPKAVIMKVYQIRRLTLDMCGRRFVGTFVGPSWQLILINATAEPVIIPIHQNFISLFVAGDSLWCCLSILSSIYIYKYVNKV